MWNARSAPARWNNVNSADFYSAVLEGEPYKVRGLMGFGSTCSWPVSTADKDESARRSGPLRSCRSLHEPDGQLARRRAADRLLLRARGAEDRLRDQRGGAVAGSVPAACRAAARRGATRYRRHLRSRGAGSVSASSSGTATSRRPIAASSAPSRRQPGSSCAPTRGGIRVPLTTRHAKHAEPTRRRCARLRHAFAQGGVLVGDVARHGYAPLPDFAEPRPPVARRAAARFPLVLTCAKPTVFCQTQHRALPSLRKRAPDPEVICIRRPRRGAASAPELGQRGELAGAMRARALLNADTDPRVVVGEHGWWQASPEADAPGYDPFSPQGSTTI